jgi:hypothetical protein
MSDTGALIFLVYLVLHGLAVYVVVNDVLGRHGHDVFDWPRKLVNWLDRKQD